MSEIYSILLPAIGSVILLVTIIISFQMVKEKNTVQIKIKEDKKFIQEIGKGIQEITDSDNQQAIHLYSKLVDRIGHFNDANLSNHKRMINSFWLASLTATVAIIVVTYSFLYDDKDLNEIQLVFGLFMTIITALYLKIYMESGKREKIFLDNARKKENLLLMIELTRNKNTPEDVKKELYTNIIKNMNQNENYK